MWIEASGPGLKLNVVSGSPFTFNSWTVVRSALLR